MDQQDETIELSIALGEAQAAQTDAESRAISAENEVIKLKEEAILLNERITQLEIANVNMDGLLQEFRVEYKPSPASVDRG